MMWGGGFPASRRCPLAPAVGGLSILLAVGAPRDGGSVVSPTGPPRPCGGRARRRNGHGPVALLERGPEPAETPAAGGGATGQSAAAFLPGPRRDGPARSRRAARGRPDARGPQPTANHGALRSTRTADRAVGRRADLHLNPPLWSSSRDRPRGGRVVLTPSRRDKSTKSDPPSAGTTQLDLPGPQNGTFFGGRSRFCERVEVSARPHAGNGEKRPGIRAYPAHRGTTAGGLWSTTRGAETCCTESAAFARAEKML